MRVQHFEPTITQFETKMDSHLFRLTFALNTRNNVPLWIIFILAIKLVNYVLLGKNYLIQFQSHFLVESLSCDLACREGKMCFNPSNRNRISEQNSGTKVRNYFMKIGRTAISNTRVCDTSALVCVCVAGNRRWNNFASSDDKPDVTQIFGRVRGPSSPEVTYQRELRNMAR